MAGITAQEVYGALDTKIKGVASGFNHADKTGDNTFTIYFNDGSSVDMTIPAPSDGVSIVGAVTNDDGTIKFELSDGTYTDDITIPTSTGIAHVESEDELDSLPDEVDVAILNDGSAENKNILYLRGKDGQFSDVPTIKGKDGKGVTIGSPEDFAKDNDAILNFDPNEIVTGDNFYNKVQADVKFAKSVEVGDVTTLVVDTWEDLVEAINTTWLAGAGGFNFDAERRILEIQTRGGQIINIDVSQIILSTNITDFRDMFVLNVLDGQSLVWNATRQKWVNKSIDASAMLDEAKAYTDDKVTKMNDAEAIACDEEPTFFGGIVTYKRGGETLQIEVTTKKIFFYYLDEDGNATQKIWVDGTPFTISMGGDFDLSDYVPKEDIIDEFDEEFLDLSKVPNTAYMKGFKDWLEVNGAGSAESVVVTEFPTHPEWKTVQNALDGIIAKIEYVKPSITSFTATPSTTVYEKGQKVASLVFKWVLNKAVTSQTLTGCTVTASDREATYSTEISAKKTFTLSVSDGENSTSANFTVDFQNKIYSGSASEGTYDSAFILGLATKKFATAKAGTYSMTVGTGQYGYIAYPKSMGQIASVKIGGFDTDMVNCGDVSFTNASGYTETYNIVRTGRSGLGAISMVVA